MALRYTLSREARLKREQHIKTLFRTGKAFSVFPLRVIWALTSAAVGETSGTRTGFSAPKKKFKRAVDRGRIKRLLREAWRLQQHELLSAIPEGQQLHLFLLFTDAAMPDHAAVFTAVGQAIVKLKKALSDA